MSLPADTPPPADIASVLNWLIGHCPVPERYLVCYSGGLDSSVLLHLLAAQRERLSAPLSAIYIDHRLHPDSRHWAAHCSEQCERLDVPLQITVVDAEPARGQSPEGAARDARYAAIATAVGRGGMALTAHHRDDQAETLLLQLLRGAGVEGLASMSPLRISNDAWHARPLLAIGRVELRAWAETQQIAWIDDPSNEQSHADRNYLRHEILPRVAARWPAAAQKIAHSAALCGEAAQLVHARAAADVEQISDDGSTRLRVESLCALSDVRARAAVRYWLDSLGAPILPERRLRELLRQLRDTRADAAVAVDYAGLSLRRFDGRLQLLRDVPFDLPRAPFDWDGEPMELDGGLGRVWKVEAPGGVDPVYWSQGRVQIGFREAGMRCRPAGRQGSRSFKAIAREQGIPPWLRSRWPLLLVDGRLAAIANGCVCESYAVSMDEIGWYLHWEIDSE